MPLKRLIASCVIIAVFLSAVGPAYAQSPAPAESTPASASTGSMLDGLVDGEQLAGGQRTRGKLGIGVGIGVLTGLVGTGIGYFVIGPEPLSAEALQRSVGKSADYQLGLKTGWERKTKSKKRNAFLAGGVLGTVALVALVVTLAEPQ